MAQVDSLTRCFLYTHTWHPQLCNNGAYLASNAMHTPLLIANPAVNKCKTAANSCWFVCLGNIKKLWGCWGCWLFYCSACGQHHGICWMLIFCCYAAVIHLSAAFVSVLIVNPYRTFRKSSLLRVVNFGERYVFKLLSIYCKADMSEPAAAYQVYSRICPFHFKGWHIHQSPTSLKQLTGNVNNIDNFVTKQFAAGRPWVLAFMWMPLWITHLNTAADQAHPIMAIALPSGNGPRRKSVLTYCKNCSGMAQRTWQEA